MIRPAYDITGLKNLDVIRTARQWKESNFISVDQYEKIAAAHPVEFFNPNLFIRIMLFVAAIIALAGATGLLFIMLLDGLGEETIFIFLALFGAGGFLLLERFIRKNHHYHSGVTEAILYFSLAFFLGGVAGLVDGETYTITVCCLLAFSFAVIRYIDLLSAAGAMCSLAYLLFYALFEAGGVFQQVIPFAFIILFLPLYFKLSAMRKDVRFELWHDPIVLCESLALIAVYAGGNYFVVRELSVSMLYLEIGPDDDIPFALVFYALTVIIPLVYLFFGIKRKDIVLLRVSLALLAFSVFTFKYYYSTGHHEITFTAAGIILIASTLILYRYLRTPRNGYTHEQLRREKWAEANPEAFVISQTLGGNVAPEKAFDGDGGRFGGGGASGTF